MPPLQGTASIRIAGAPAQAYVDGRWHAESSGSLVATGDVETGSGSMAGIGAYTSLSQGWTCGGETAAECFRGTVFASQELPALVFRQEWPSGTNLTAEQSLNTTAATLGLFPAFQGGHNSSVLSLADLGFLTWYSEFAVTPSYRTGVWPTGFRGGYEGGSPLALFDEGGRTLMVSPLDDMLYGVNTVYNGTSTARVVSEAHNDGEGGGGLACGPHGMLRALPPGHKHDTLIVLDQGVASAHASWGDVLLARHGKRRVSPDDSDALRFLMYSGDAYYYYDPASGNTTCGEYESEYAELAATNREAAIPFAGPYGIDSWWYGQAINNGISTWDKDSPCFAERFPRGLPWLRTQLQTTGFVAHMGTWLAASPYAEHYDFVADPMSIYALPTEFRFWDDLLRNATSGPDGWGLSVIKQDHMDQQVGCLYSHQTPACHAWAPLTTLGVATAWHAQQAQAAAKHGVTIELGTALPNQVLNTVTLPQSVVTHVRGANDYVPAHVQDAWRIGPAALYFWAVGMYTTKDTFLSNSSETTPRGEFSGFYEPYPELHATVSALSAGPVSPSDGAGAANRSLLMRTCRADGVVLKPDAPAVPLDALWIGQVFGSASAAPSVPSPPVGDVYATGARVAGTTLPWLYAFASLNETYSVTTPQLWAHVASLPSIYGEGRVEPAGSAPPTGATWVAYRPGVDKLATPTQVVGTGAEADTITLAAGATYGDFDYVALAPVLDDSRGWAVLGETAKIVPVSRQRVTGVEVDGGAGALRLSLAGVEGENVTIAFARVLAASDGVHAASVEVTQQSTVIGADGAGTIIVSTRATTPVSTTQVPDDPVLSTLAVNVGPAQQMGGPVGNLYDSPFQAVDVPQPDGTSVVRGYSANQESFVVTQGGDVGALLDPPVSTSLTRSLNASDLDHCGSWLNAAARLPSDAPGVVRGWYHEEWRCDYARNSYTNKSIAYAESTDGGKTFVKVGHPHNAIIAAPIGNTTAVHQTGEGDHGVAVAGDGYMYLFFRQWDGWPAGHVTRAVARAPQSSGGVPGSWHKWYNGAWSQPGVNGNSTLLHNMPGTPVVWRGAPANDFLTVGLECDTLYGPPTFGRSTDAVHWSCGGPPLIPYTPSSWVRTADQGELIGYISMTGDKGNTDFPASLPASAWLWYTYLEPGATFADRYLVRRPLSLSVAGAGSTGTHTISLSVFQRRAGASGGADLWTTTALIPQLRGYAPLREVGRLLTAAPAGEGANATRPLYDCYISAWDDHMVGVSAAECNTTATRRLRTLGWAWKEAGTSTAGHSDFATRVPLYRCFNNATKDHSVSTLEGTCEFDAGASVEFILGFIDAVPSLPR